MGQAACCQEEVDKNDSEDSFLHGVAHGSSNIMAEVCCAPPGTTEIHPVPGQSANSYGLFVDGSFRDYAEDMTAECEKKQALELTAQRRAHIGSDATRAGCLAKHAALWAEDAYRMMGVDPTMCGLEAAHAVGRAAAGGPEGDSQARRSRRVCLTVHRDSLNDRLGMHVKHVGGQLVLVGIDSHGALSRASSLSGARGGDTLKAGDVIVQINEVRGDDAALVRECEEKATLVIRALRF